MMKYGACRTFEDLPVAQAFRLLEESDAVQ